MRRVLGGSVFARVARQQLLKSAAHSVSRHELQPSMLRCIRCRAATAPGAVPHAHMIPRLCAPVWLADSLATVIVLMRSAVFFMITHCSRLLRLAELKWTCSRPCLRLAVHEQYGWRLRSAHIGRKTSAGLGVAWVRVWLLHGSCGARRLQVHAATVAPMLVCVTAVGRGHVATRMQRQDRWFGPHGPRKSRAGTGLICEATARRRAGRRG